jgi:ubiquinone/menaquinone biosynthesis C-methylase UbiE
MTYSTYALPVSLQDNERFRSTTVNLNQISWSHLEVVTLKSDFVVADIGCGDGEIVIYLLDKVYKIYAIDLSQEKLDKVKENVETWILNNLDKKVATVEYLCLDVTKNTIIPHNSLDLVFMRYVFNNINTSMHDTILSNIHKILKPEGKLVCEEPIWKTLHCSQNQDIIIEFKTFLCDQNKKRNLDRNTGISVLNKILNSNKYSLNYYNIINRHITVKEFKAMYHFLISIIKTEINNERCENYNALFESWTSVIDSLPEDESVKIQTSGTACITAIKI